jgi:hypothetical protein
LLLALAADELKKRPRPAASQTAAELAVGTVAGVLGSAAADRLVHIGHAQEVHGHATDRLRLRTGEKRFEGPLDPEVVDLLERLRAWGGNVDGESGIEDNFRHAFITHTDLTVILWRFFCQHVAFRGGVVAATFEDLFAFTEAGKILPPPVGWQEGGWRLLGPPC